MNSNIFQIGDKLYRRGHGIIYVAHPAAKIINRSFQRRFNRAKRRKVSPSTARFERRHDIRG